MLTKLMANKGKALPLKVKKKLIFIEDKEPTEINLQDLDYESQAFVKKAILDKDIFVVTDKEPAPKKAKGDK